MIARFDDDAALERFLKRLRDDPIKEHVRYVVAEFGNDVLFPAVPDGASEYLKLLVGDEGLVIANEPNHLMHPIA